MGYAMSELRGHERTRGGARAIGRGALGGGNHAQTHFVRDGCYSKGVASGLGGHVWGRPWRWALWSLALVLALVPRLALAAPFFEVERNWADIEGNDVYYGYLVVDCPSAYQASLLLIDEYSSLVQIDTETYNKLMSPSTGGRFYELVQEWGAVGPAEGNNQRIYPAWAGDVGFQMGLVNVYGYQRVWGAEVTDTLKASAKEDFQAILGGGSVGGGGSGGGSSGTNTPEGYWHGGNRDGNVFTLVGIGDYNASDSLTLTVNDAVSDWIDQQEAAGRRVAIEVYEKASSSATYYKCFVGYVGSGVYATDDGTYGQLVFHNTSSSTRSLTGWTKQIKSPNTLTLNDVSSFSYSMNANTGIRSFYNVSGERIPIYAAFDWSEGSSDPEPDPEPDPDPQPTPGPNPTAPNPPDLPEPGDPVVPDPPEPVGPGDTTITTNITITNVTNPSNTTPADYTPWLEALLNELKGLHTDLGVAFNQLWGVLDEHCVHIQDKIAEGSNYVGDCVQGVSATVSSGFSALLDYLRTLFQGLFEFLEEQSQWLVDNLRFVTNVTVDQYDDTSLLYWLRRIYARLGSGIVNTRPTDPVTDWDPWAEWLAQLVQHILNVLTGGIGGVIGSVISAISNLSGVFPFCIPFDLLLLMDAITTDPVTPYISVSIPATDWYDTFTISVDCDVYDDAMEVVRSFELLAFVVYVMLHSKELFGWNAGEFSKFWNVGNPT